MAIRVDRFAKQKRFVSLEKGSGLKALDEMDYHSLLGKSCNAIYNCKLLFLQIITFLQVRHNVRAFIYRHCYHKIFSEKGLKIITF